MKQGTPISLQDVTYNLRHRLRSAWRFVVKFHQNVRKPIRLPGYLHLDLPQHVIQIVSRFRLRAHNLSVETVPWEDGISPVCNRCSCGQTQACILRDIVLIYCAHLFGQSEMPFIQWMRYLTLFPSSSIDTALCGKIFPLMGALSKAPN
eukprot:140246-Pelagomonas_calceolata.AAC.3